MNRYEADKEGRALKRLNNTKQRVINEATNELRQLDADARKPGFSKEKAARRKQEIYKAMKKDGLL